MRRNHVEPAMRSNEEHVPPPAPAPWKVCGVREISSHPEGSYRGNVPQLSLRGVMRKNIWRGGVRGRRSGW